MIRTPNYRYSVEDDCCGLVNYREKREQAFQLARGHARLHEQEGDSTEVRVRDSMAQHGAFDLWRADGRELRRKA